MIYHSLLEFTQLYVKQVMSRFADFLPCSTASRNVVSPIVVPYTESSQMEMNIMSPQISGTTSPSSQSVRDVVRPRSVDHPHINSPGAANCTLCSNPTHSTIHSLKTLPSRSEFTSPQSNQHDSESFAALRQDLKVVLGVTVESKDEILSQITVLQNKFTTYDTRLENIESRISLIEEQSLISLETSASRVNEFLDCEKSDLLPDDRMMLRNHKRVGKPNTD